MNEETYREHLNSLQLEVEALRARLKEAQTGDLISRQAAIDLVKSRSYDLSEREDEWAMVQDVEELPSVQPTQNERVNSNNPLDCISRQAALDALMGAFCDTMIESICKDTIEALPSAHCDYCPYPEDYDGRVPVVRCKDCTYRNGDYCHRFHDGYSAFVHQDDYCSYAERITDERQEHTMEEFMYGQDMGNPEDGSL